MNALLQEALMGTRHISHAAIIRQKDNAIKLTAADISRLELAFDQPRQTRLLENGITFLEVPYKAVRADSTSVYAKNDKAGVVIVRTAQHYIFASYDPTMYASVAVEAVEKLGDYFRKKNK